MPPALLPLLTVPMLGASDVGIKAVSPAPLPPNLGFPQRTDSPTPAPAPFKDVIAVLPCAPDYPPQIPTGKGSEGDIGKGTPAPLPPTKAFPPSLDLVAALPEKFPVP
eukprot:6195852-Pleurochrysis_carterae.AAC.1